MALPIYIYLWPLFHTHTHTPTVLWGKLAITNKSSWLHAYTQEEHRERAFYRIYIKPALVCVCAAKGTLITGAPRISGSKRCSTLREP